jgi:uncharacterized repeat protein (TIGR01451 family)
LTRSFFLGVVSLLSTIRSSNATDSIPAAKDHPASPFNSAQYFAMPLQFEANVGQTHESVKFLSRGPGYSMFLAHNEMVLSVQLQTNQAVHSKPTGSWLQNRRDSRTPLPIKPRAELHISLKGAQDHPAIEGVGPSQSSVSYFMGNDQSQWHPSVPTFAKIIYHDAYPGVDLVYYGNQRQLEHDFVVKPGADPSRISLTFKGSDRLEISEDGSLVVHLGGSLAKWRPPVAYQIGSTGKQTVTASFVINDRNEVGFQLGNYDKNQSLVIDPVMVYGTLLGGSGDDYVCGIAVDAAGNTYIVGQTTSLDFPVVSAYHTTSAGSNDIFVTKLNAAGSALIYSTYIGGSADEVPGGIALDSSGNVYVAGQTLSTDFPTKNAYQSANAGFNDIFLTKIGPFGSNLLYSTYLGGKSDDTGRAVAADNSGNAYVTGQTYSIGTGNGPFPTTHSAYQGNSGGGADAFVSKFNTLASGSSSLVYSTFLGGNSDEKANGITIDASGNAYVVGEIASYPIYPTPPSSNFPLVNPYQSLFNNGNLDPLAGNTDGFLTVMNSAGSGLILSTFLGGGDEDSASAVALDPAGRICIVGETSSLDFPVKNAAQPIIGGADTGFPAPDAFATILQPGGASLYYSSYLGGSGYESGFETYRFGVAVDRLGAVYLAGYTDSLDDFPLTVGADQTNAYGPSDAFVAKINPAVPGPAGLIYSTLLGGEGDDRATAVAVDSAGSFYVSGNTTSQTNFPVTAGAFQLTNNGGYSDAFVAKFASPPDISIVMTPSLDPVVRGSNFTYSIQINNNGYQGFSGVSNIVQLATNYQILSVNTSQGAYSTNGSTINFNIGSLATNATVTQSILLKAISPGFFTNTATLTSIETALLEPNTGNNVAAVPAAIAGIVDIKLDQTSTPNPALLTSNITYSFSINNKQGDMATYVALTDALPAQVSFVSATATVGTVTNLSGVVVCTITNLAQSSNSVVTITVQATNTGVAVNSASVSSFEFDSNPANNSASVITTINPLADLGAGLSASAGAVYVGSPVFYTAQVTNFGPSTATGTVLTQPLPPGANFGSAAPSQGSCLFTNGILTCALGSLSSNASASVAITLYPTAAGTMTNTVTASSGVADGGFAPNAASVVTTVIPAADVSVGQSVSPNVTLISSNVTFSIRVTNNGPSQATSVVLNDSLPASLPLRSVTTSQGSSSISNGVIIWSLGSLNAGSVATATIVAGTVVDGSFTSIASVSASQADLSPGNNSALASVLVNDNPNQPQLKIALSAPNVILSWSTNANGFVLQTRSNLSSSSVWATVTNIPVSIGGRYYVTNSISDGQRFYRLFRPPPMLSAFVSGNNLVVTWPVTVPGGTLKTTINLNSGPWTTVPNTPASVGGRYYVTNSINGARAFYRLFN